jgi:uncharacterized Zn finger protein
MSRRYYDDFNFFPPSTPLEAKGGIKAQTKRGAFGTSWWAKRWIAVLESFNIGARLGRGRTYARKGQVTSLEVDSGSIKAKVQGSRSGAYSVKIIVKTLPKSEWNKIIKALSKQPIFTAKLLAGEMPEDIEKIFDDLKLSLFPNKFNDLKTDCNCPDWSNPCKHIAAVFYLLGEEFDRDPFLMFKIRGMDRDQLLKNLPQTVSRDSVLDTTEIPEESFPPEPLTTESTTFWQGGELSDEIFGKVEIAPVNAALPKRLGNFPYWRGKERFLESIEPIYDRASSQGLNVFLGELD